MELIVIYGESKKMVQQKVFFFVVTNLIFMIACTKGISQSSKNINEQRNMMMTNNTSTQKVFIPDLSSVSIDNKLYIQGINEDEKLVSYITETISSGRGDIKYLYIVYNYKTNTIIELLEKRWIASGYGEEGILDWNDEKYSVTSYKHIIQETIKNISKKYSLSEFNFGNVSHTNSKIIVINRTAISGLSENIEYEIHFEIDEKEYSYCNRFEHTGIVKNVNIFNIFRVKDYFLVLEQLAHEGFEDNDYYDYIIHGLKI